MRRATTHHPKPFSTAEGSFEFPSLVKEGSGVDDGVS